MIRPYKTKDKQDLINYCIIQNPEKDFSEIKYLINRISKQNLNCYLADDGKISGFVLIEKNEDKYELSIVSDDSNNPYKLMKYLIWHTDKDLHAHFSEWHSHIKLLKKFGFRFYSSKESSSFDLIRKFDKKYYFPKKDLRYDYH